MTVAVRNYDCGSTCDPKATETATIMNNNTVNPFGKLFGGDFGNGTSSLLVLPVTTMVSMCVWFAGGGGSGGGGVCVWWWWWCSRGLSLYHHMDATFTVT